MMAFVLTPLVQFAADAFAESSAKQTRQPFNQRQTTCEDVYFVTLF